MRTLQVGDRPTQLALALAEFGRIEKNTARPETILMTKINAVQLTATEPY